MKKYFFISLLIFLIFNLSAQTKITYKGSGNYTLRERTDLRQYNNGKYIGLVSREVTSFIVPVAYENGYKYEGSFFVQQGTMHSAKEVGFGLRYSIPSTFKISKEGNLTMLEDNGYPSFRSFPSFPNKEIKIGDSWQGKAERAVDPLNKGIVTKMPIYVQYKYTGDDNFNGEPVYLISAQWATRYGSGSGTSYIDWGGDRELEKAIGSHKATIIVSKITGNSLVVRDNVDETYYFADGNVIQYKGTIALFTEYPPAIDRSKLIPALKRICELSDSEASDLMESSDTNTQISMLNAKASPEDSSLIDSITSALKSDASSGKAEIIKDDLQKTTLTADNQPVAAEDLPTLDSFGDKLTKTDLVSDDAALLDSLETERAEKVKKQEELTQKVLAFAENNKKEATNKTKIAVDATPAGIRLSIQDLQFKANSSELLPGEADRLDQIAEVLKTVPDAQLLVEGHTASTGNPKGEQELSVERAEAIAKALTQRGIAAGRFICKGFGGRKPIADNGTSQGKARNRRVEITILD